jgi:5,10-methylenetetrahydrofolate reductase
VNFKEALDHKQFVVTAEIAPPKGTDLSAAYAEADLIKSFVDGINVTDNQRAIMRLSPISLCHKLAHKGFSPIMQMTCRDRNRLALQADLLSAWVLGVENILALTGDAMNAGDHADAKPVFDMDAVSLLETAAALNQGEDSNGKQLLGSPRFLLGAAMNPGAEPKELQIMQMEKKIKAGARFFQTQLIFDITDFKTFLGMASPLIGRHIKILAGIFPLKSAQQARFLAAKVPGVKIPELVIQRMEKASDQVNEGILIAQELIQQLRDVCGGVHIMSMGNKDTLITLLQKINA